jgi:leucyl-tRNA synthetase
LRDAIKQFRTQHAKASKGSTAVSILISDNYPKWKIDTLLWMQEQFDAEAGFSNSFMKDVKAWTGTNISDKKMIKFTMQFASFVKKEVEDVGAAAMDIQLPYDQKSILSVSERYIKSQLNVTELDIIKLDDGMASEVPERVAENVSPGKPYLWMH